MADRCPATFRPHVAATLMLTLRDTAERCPTYAKLAEVSPGLALIRPTPIYVSHVTAVSKAQVEQVWTLAASADVCKALVGVG